MEEFFERVQILGGGHVGLVGGAEGLDGVVEEFVDDAAGEFFEVLALLRREVGELVEGAGEFFFGDGVVALVEAADGGA